VSSPPKDADPAEKSGRECYAECYCTKVKSVCKQLIISWIVVEAAGVEPATTQQGPLIPQHLGRIAPQFNPRKGRVCGVLRRSCGEVETTEDSSCWCNGDITSIDSLALRCGSLAIAAHRDVIHFTDSTCSFVSHWSRPDPQIPEATQKVRCELEIVRPSG